MQFTEMKACSLFTVILTLLDVSTSVLTKFYILECMEGSIVQLSVSVNIIILTILLAAYCSSCKMNYYID